jgi:hypothetical protein
MSITGLPFLILMAGLTVAVFAAVILKWPRFRHRSIKALLGRLAAIGAAQFMLLATVTAGANAYFGFYTSWSDLAGAAGASNYQGSRPPPLGSGPSAGAITVNSRSGLDIPGGNDPAKAGQLLDTTIAGPLTGLSAHALIYLPPQYFQDRYQATQFPAVIVSSGYPGDATKLVTLLRYPTRLLTAVNTGHGKPAVLIMMSPMILPGRDTECTNVPGGPQAGTFWSQDVTAAVERSYRVTANPRGWGLIGDSTGGYCAVKLAMMNSDKFSTAVSLSGYYDAIQDRTTGDLYGADQAFRNQNDLLWRLRNLPSPPVSVLLTTSRTGESNYAPTMDFQAAAQSPMHVSTLVRAEGGHNFNTWNAEIPAALQWLTTQLVAPPEG